VESKKLYISAYSAAEESLRPASPQSVKKAELDAMNIIGLWTSSHLRESRICDKKELLQ